MSFSSVWNTVYPILVAILFFELIILVHEGGHYVAARLMKIKVNEFSIGMGPKLIQFKKKDTLYTLRLVLFGGYCSMEGEDSESDDESAFMNKKVIQRIFVVVAGAVMNLVLGLIIVFILVCSQNLVGTNEIAQFDDNAMSAQTGLQEGDVIKSIDGMRIYTTNDITTGLSRSRDNTVEMIVARNGEDKKLNVTFDTDVYEGTEYLKMDFWIRGVHKTPANVLVQTGKEYISFARMVFLSLHDLILGRFGLKDLSGPVGAVTVVSDAVKTSLYSVLKIMALLTINIGLFNLSPIPALDGWRLFVLIGEGVTRKKLPQKLEYSINAVGLVLLLGLMSVVTFSDITKLF